MLNKLAASLLIGLAMLVPAAFAQVTVNISEGVLKPTPIAVPTFNVSNGADEQLAAEITKVVQNDLVSTGLFTITPESAHIQRDLSIDNQPRFADWRIIDTESLGIGEVEIMDDGRMRVAFRLWDTAQEQEHLLSGRRGRQYVTTSENLRRVAHVLADDIYTSLTGDEGYFDSRIVFIAESGPRTARVKRLAIMDQDGANPEFLTNEKHLVLTPRFSPTAQTITYMTYESNRPQVYLFDINTGRSESLGQFDGMTYAPRFSPDGQNVVFTQEINGNSELYILNLTRRETTRRGVLTESMLLSVSPSGSTSSLTAAKARRCPSCSSVS